MAPGDYYTEVAGEAESGNFSLVTAPTAGYVNLRAQRGVFLLHRAKRIVDLEKCFSCLPVERRLAESGPTNIRLLKFTVPVSESRMLLRLLAKDGVNGAALFPTYEGAAKAAREELWWDTTSHALPHAAEEDGGPGGSCGQHLLKHGASSSS
jgi:hypothetical protein